MHYSITTHWPPREGDGKRVANGVYLPNDRGDVGRDTLTLPRGWRLQGGVNNLADRRYFTRRTDEYPGPGILPSSRRSVYVTLRAAP